MQASRLHVGLCRGGPCDGQEVESRFPDGFLAVERQKRKVWIYDRNPETGEFVARRPIADTLNDELRWRAASEPHYDVRAVETGGDE